MVTLLELADQAADPRRYSTFLMWLLTELFEGLPPAGGPEKPKLVFFFDEAHLLFTDASKAFLERVEPTVKLIGPRASACSSAPSCPPTCRTRCCPSWARIQHALRAFTPRTRRRWRRPCVPTRGRRTTTWSPRVSAAAHGSPPHARYGATVDRESAYEELTARLAEAPPAAVEDEPRPRAEPLEPGFVEKASRSPVARSFLRSAAGAPGREITRGLFGTRRRRR